MAKICGFSFIRNAEEFDYPIVEALTSILPVCQEIVVCVGSSTDNTRELVASVSPKITIIDTVWDDQLRKGGQVLAIETNKALQTISSDYDWCFYIQGDEVLADGFVDEIEQACNEHRDNPQVDGLLFNYRHFYGSYDFVANSSKWYRKEVRIIKNRSDIRSYKDAQGFRKNSGKKLLVKPLTAYIHHYGYVKHPKDLQKKNKSFNKLWHDDQWVKEQFGDAELYDYSNIDRLVRFEGIHPAVMQKRIEDQNWDFQHDPSIDRRTWKRKFKDAINNRFNTDFGNFRNYEL